MATTIGSACGMQMRERGILPGPGLGWDAAQEAILSRLRSLQDD
jgi:hypothetical protein